jgi:hypothetical protein
MKMMKWALLGGAALAVTASGAQANDLADLKAQMESMQSRINQLEARPAAPADGSWLKLSKGETPAWINEDKKVADRGNDMSHLITVVPTADADPGTVVTWSGTVRAILGYDDDSEAFQVFSRIRLVVSAQTDTAVGTVGVSSEFGADGEGFDINDDDQTFKNYWGWWEFSPGWKFSGGFRGTVANINHGQDENVQVGATVASNGGDSEQLRLTYSSGAIEWNLGIEDYEPTDEGAVLDSDLPAATANVNWTNDSFSARLMAGVGEDEADGGGGDLDWVVGAGATFGLGDIAVFSLAASYGEGWRVGSDDEILTASAYLRFDLTEQTFTELSAGYADVEGDEALVFNGGIYWKPVSQLKMGLNASYTDDEGDDNFQAGFVTWWSF